MIWTGLVGWTGVIGLAGWTGMIGCTGVGWAGVIGCTGVGWAKSQSEIQLIIIINYVS